MSELASRVIRFLCHAETPLRFAADGQLVLSASNLQDLLLQWDGLLDVAWLSTYRPCRLVRACVEPQHVVNLEVGASHYVIMAGLRDAIRTCGLADPRNEAWGMITPRIHTWAAESRPNVMLEPLRGATSSASSSTVASSSTAAESDAQLVTVHAEESYVRALLQNRPLEQVISFYEARSRDAVVTSAALAEAQRTVQKQQNMTAYWKHRFETAQSSLQAYRSNASQAALCSKTDAHTILSTSSSRNGKRYSTRAQGLGMALKSIVSNVASYAMAASQGDDVHGQTVITWKTKLHAALNCCSVQFNVAGRACMRFSIFMSNAVDLHDEGGETADAIAQCDRLGITEARWDELGKPPQPQPFAISATGIISDATNSTVWKRSPLLACVVKQSYLPVPIESFSLCSSSSCGEGTGAIVRCEDAASDAALCESAELDSLLALSTFMDQYKTLCDILPIDDKSAYGAHELVSKMLRCIGVVTPKEACAALSAEDTGHKWLQMHFLTADAGSDEIGNAQHLRTGGGGRGKGCCCSGTRALATSLPRRSNHVWYLPTGVWRGSSGVSTNTSAPREDKNCWRQYFKAVWDACLKVDSKSAKTFAQQTPPRCLASRWGSADDARERLTTSFTWSWVHFVVALTLAMDPKGPKSRFLAGRFEEIAEEGDEAPRAPRGPRKLEDPCEEDSAIFRAKYTKWKSASLGACWERCQPFRRMCQIMQNAQAPFIHFYAIITKKVLPGEPNPVARLVWGDVQRLPAEFDSKLSLSHWADFLASLEVPEHFDVGGTGGEHMPLIVHASIEVIFVLSLRNAAGFDRRIAKLLMRDYQYQFLLIASNAPDTVCEVRKAFCQRLALDRPDAWGRAASGTAFKNRSLFMYELQQSSLDGKCDRSLWRVAATAALDWDGDSRVVDWVNSCIKHQSQKGRRSNLDTINANIVPKFMLGLGSRSAPTKWSDIRGSAARVLAIVDGCYDQEAIDAINGSPRTLQDLRAALEPSLAPSLTSKSANVLLGQRTRWGRPLRDAYIREKRAATKPTDSSPRVRWAAAANLMWHKALTYHFGDGNSFSSLVRCCSLGPRVPLKGKRPLTADNLGRVWLCPDVLKYVDQLAQCTLVNIVHPEPCKQRATMDLVRPVTFDSSIEVFLQMYDDAACGPAEKTQAITFWNLELILVDADTYYLHMSKPKFQFTLDNVKVRSAAKKPRSEPPVADAEPSEPSDPPVPEVEEDEPPVPEIEEGELAEWLGDMMAGEHDADEDSHCWQWTGKDDENILESDHALIKKHGGDPVRSRDLILDGREAGTHGVLEQVFSIIQEAEVQGAGDEHAEIDSRSILESWADITMNTFHAYAHAQSHAWPNIGVHHKQQNMSLVVEKDIDGILAVRFIHWLVMGKKGQTVSLHDGRWFKCSTPSFNPSREIDMSRIQMVDVDVGQRMQKLIRPECPEPLLRLEAVFECMTETSAEVLPNACQSCQQYVPDTSRCARCLLHWHESCCEVLANNDLARQYLGDASLRLRSDASFDCIPAIGDVVSGSLAGVICQLCFTVLDDIVSSRAG